LLSDGKVIGTFQGRMEMGPRALGNRSVLADPRSLEMKDKINAILKGREWFVPFAPMVLAEDAHLYWEGAVEYRYMTFAVKASEYAARTVPAVVHFDGTMRPQVVSQDFNPWAYEVLQQFKKITGVGLLLNTSFNRHGLPIVGAPADALEHLVNDWVDGLSMGRWYIERAVR
jgi:carbamoyltransferase